MTCKETLNEIVERIKPLAKDTETRLLVAIAGPPGSGKSTLSQQLSEYWNVTGLPESQVIQLDGFHYDDEVLLDLGLSERKGSPDSFDVDGFGETLKRLVFQPSKPVAIPVYDRTLELSRGAARIILPSTKVLFIEGNYLLLSDNRWTEFEKLYDFTIYLEVDLLELEKRLIKRWVGYGHSSAESKLKAGNNDLPNAETVINNSGKGQLGLVYSSSCGWQIA